MNAKKIFKYIGRYLLLIVGIIFTATFVYGKIRAINVTGSIRTELESQREENKRLRITIDILQRKRAEDKRRIEELEDIQQRLDRSNSILEELGQDYERRNRDFEIDIRELEGIQREDRETINRIREILQKENS